MIRWARARLAKIKLAMKKGKIERKKYGIDFKASLYKEARGYLPLVGFIAIFAWLDFAFNTDPKLHPDFPELLYFRLGFSLVGLIVLVASLIPRVLGTGMLWMYLVAGYCLLSCALFTGRIADDPNYVSGFQIIIFIICIAPLTRRGVSILFGISIVLFLGAVFVYKPYIVNKVLDAGEISKREAEFNYSMNNLLLAYIMSYVLGFFLNKFRFNLFVRHREVELLKEKQDGDYYLTSALIKPLSDPEFESENVVIRSYVDQYKKFHFRKWDSEIGGDFCSAGKISLKHRDYAIFLNADAMGKSIQGAGGALVMGTVFKSVVARNQNMVSDKDQFPEQWLKRLLVELQEVFIAFEGSMLISAIIGLIDLENGMVYYINSEHPFAVLFRDGKASFIEKDLQLRKIGIETEDYLLSIKTFVMNPGDKLLLGSDGRDDLQTGLDEAGNRLINENEELFLDAVERAKGDIEAIPEAIIVTGTIIDDLSLMSVYFRGQIQRPRLDHDQEQEITDKLGNLDNADDLLDLVQVFQSIGDNAELARRLYSLYIKNKFYQQAVDLCETYINNNPSDTEFLYLTGYSAKLLYRQNRQRNTLLKAADYAERTRLREREQVKNLVNLANVHQLLGNRQRSEKIIAEIKKYDPENSKLELLQSALTDQ